MAIHIDLRRGIPRARKVLDTLQLGRCDYTAPCVIGAMVAPAKRVVMEDFTLDETTIATLAGRGIVRAPKNQLADMTLLQNAFDSGDRARFLATFESIASKYEAPANA